MKRIIFVIITLSTLLSCKSTPQDTPNIVESFYFQDDLDHTDNWDLNNSYGTWEIRDEDGNNFLHYEVSKRPKSPIALLKPGLWKQTPDFYVDTRIRFLDNKKAYYKQVYLILGYEDAKTWYGGGLTVPGSTDSSRTSLGFMKGKKVEAVTSTSYPISFNTWNDFRLEVKDGVLTSYVNGQLCDSVSLSDEGFSDILENTLGIWTYNRSFDIDYIKVGDPIYKPVSLTVEPAISTYSTRAKENPLTLDISAALIDGSMDSFTVTSSNPEVVEVKRKKSSITLNALMEGESNIVITSGAGREHFIHANIQKPYLTGTLKSKTIKNVVTPTLGSRDVYYDDNLIVELDKDITEIRPNKSVRIYSKSGELIDEISTGEEIDYLAYGNSVKFRGLKRDLIISDGNRLIITPHNAALQSDTTYFIEVEEGLVTNNTINEQPFDGISKKSKWSFTTKKEVDVSQSTLTVSNTGNSDFRTIQGALNFIMKHSLSDVTVEISSGTYYEPLYLYGVNNIKIIGESRDGVQLSYLNAEKFNQGTGKGSDTTLGTPQGGRALFFIENCDLITISNMSMRNSHTRTGNDDQAEVIYFNTPGDGRLIVDSVNLYSEQDTIQVRGYSWFYNCLVEGNVDFIWGNNRTTLFENCEIRTIGDSKLSTDSGRGGYLLQARTVNKDDVGFVFLNCALTYGPGPLGKRVDPGSTYLARSGGSGSYLDYITFINCTMDAHIAPIGWAEKGVEGQPSPNPVIADSRTGWKEYNTKNPDGSLLDIKQRSRSAHILTKSEVEGYFDSRESIFANYNNSAGWIPVQP